MPDTHQDYKSYSRNLTIKSNKFIQDVEKQRNKEQKDQELNASIILDESKVEI